MRLRRAEKRARGLGVVKENLTVASGQRGGVESAVAQEIATSALRRPAVGAAALRMGKLLDDELSRPQWPQALFRLLQALDVAEG